MGCWHWWHDFKRKYSTLVRLYSSLWKYILLIFYYIEEKFRIVCYIVSWIAFITTHLIWTNYHCTVFHNKFPWMVTLLFECCWICFYFTWIVVKLKSGWNKNPQKELTAHGNDEKNLSRDSCTTALNKNPASWNGMVGLWLHLVLSLKMTENW